MNFKIKYIVELKEAQQTLLSIQDRYYDPKAIPFASKNITEAYFRTMVLVSNGHEPLGCVCIYKNEALFYDKKNTWCIGNFECAQDPSVGTLILTEAQNFVRSNGGEFIIGPMNGSTWDDYRFSLSSSSSLFFTENYKLPYYRTFFEDFGFSSIANYYSAKDRAMQFNKEHILELKSEMEKKGIVFRPIDTHKFEKELEVLYPFLTKAFETNFLYTPIDKNRFYTNYKSVLNYIDPEFTLMAFDETRELVGLFFCLPNYFDSAEKGLVIKTIARKKDAHLKGLGHVMAEIMYEKASQSGFKYMIHAFMHKQGTSVKISNTYSGELLKEYTLYGKEI